MLKVTKPVFVSNPVAVQYTYPHIVYHYLLSNNIINMSQKQFNKSFVKCIPQFNQYSKKQKAQIFVYTQSIYNDYVSTNQI